MYYGTGMGWAVSPFAGLALPLLIIVLAWSIGWKGWALWLAARRGSTVWFIILLIVNTIGILDIIYIFFVAKQQDTRDEMQLQPAKEEGVPRQ